MKLIPRCWVGYNKRMTRTADWVAVENYFILSTHDDMLGYMQYQHRHWKENEKHLKVLFPSENERQQ